MRGFGWWAALLVAVHAVAISAPATAQSANSGNTLSVNGVDLYYETIGEGEPLLLVHGWSGNSEYFRPLLEALSRHYRLIVPELRGHGRSTNPGGDFSIGHTASDVLALLDHLGLEHVRALGASAGGLTLLRMALDDPNAIDAMVVVGVGTRFPVACLQSMAATDADNFPPEWWEIMRSRHPHGDVQIREIAAYLRSLASVDEGVGFTVERLSELEARTLIVQGDSDWCFPTPLVAEMQQAIPDAALWVIPNGEHVPILGERAPMFLELTLQFFRGDPLE